MKRLLLPLVALAAARASAAFGGEVGAPAWRGMTRADQGVLLQARIEPPEQVRDPEPRAGSVAAGALRLNLDNAPGLALARNPSLLAARLRIEEARGRLQQSGRLANPEVELGYRQNVRTPENAFGALFFQRFPVTARLRLERAATRAGLAAAVAEVRNEERKLVAEVRGAVVRLLALREQRALRDRQLTNGRELTAFLRQRAAVGEASSLDADLLELETGGIEAERLGLDVERATRLGELQTLLGVGPGSEIVLVGGLPELAGVSAAADADPSRRPDFIASQRHADAARRETEVARAQRWGDVGVGLNFDLERTEDAPDGLRREGLMGLRVNVPLPLWNDNSGRVREAAAAAVRAERETGALALAIRAEAATARAEMAVLSRVVRDVDQRLLPKAAQLEARTREAFNSGLVPLPDVLRARDRRLTLQRQRLDALRDFHLARIRHEAATGRVGPAEHSGR